MSLNNGSLGSLDTLLNKLRAKKLELVNFSGEEGIMDEELDNVLNDNTNYRYFDYAFGNWREGEGTNIEGTSEFSIYSLGSNQAGSLENYFKALAKVKITVENISWILALSDGTTNCLIEWKISKDGGTTWTTIGASTVACDSPLASDFDVLETEVNIGDLTGDLKVRLGLTFDKGGTTMLASGSETNFTCKSSIGINTDQ